MALDGLGDAGVKAPAPGEYAADQSVIDAKLATLLGDPLVRGRAAAVEALGVARMKACQHRPADVVEDRGEGHLVTVPDAAHLCDPVGGPLHVEGMQAEAVGREGEPAVAIEDVVCGAERRIASTAPGPRRSTRRRRCECGPPPCSWPAARTIAHVRPTSDSTTLATSCGGAPRFTCSSA